MWILGLKGLIARENNGTESKMPSLGLGAVFFSQVNHLKLVRGWVLERSTNFYSVCCPAKIIEHYALLVCPVQQSALFGLRQLSMDFMNFQTIN